MTKCDLCHKDYKPSGFRMVITFTDDKGFTDESVLCHKCRYELSVWVLKKMMGDRE